MTETPSPSQKESIENRLEELSQRPPFPGAQAPEPAAFTDARAFAAQLPTPLSSLPYISLADDGEINFTWNTEQISIDLGFYGTGTYSYFSRDRHGAKHHGDGVPAPDPHPE